MMLAFGTLQPDFAVLPHVVFRAGSTVFKCMSMISQTSVGLWGREPRYNNDGDSYCHEADTMPAEDFVLWRHPKNQAMIEGGLGNGLKPQMYISTDTSSQTLIKMGSYYIEPGDTECFYKMVVDIIDELTWACLIPACEGIQYNVFVVSKSNASYLKSFREALHKYGQQENKPLQMKHNYFTWPLDTASMTIR